MSVSGPCAWVSTVPSPATHSPAITSSWATVSWNGEQELSKSRVNPPALSGVGGKAGEQNKVSATEMQSTVIKAEKTFSVPPAPGPASAMQYPGDGASLDGLQAQNTNVQGDTMSRLKIGCLSAGNRETEATQTNDEIAFKVKPEISDDLHEDERDNSEINAASSDDDEAGSSVGGEKRASQDSKSDKKKMKRFR